MKGDKASEVVTFWCTRETYCLLQELAELEGWTVSYYCYRVMSYLVARWSGFLLSQGGGEQDG